MLRAGTTNESLKNTSTASVNKRKKETNFRLKL